MYTVYVWVIKATTGSHYKEKFNAWNKTETSSVMTLDWDQNYTVGVSAWNKYGESSPVLEEPFKTGKLPPGSVHEFFVVKYGLS